MIALDSPQKMMQFVNIDCNTLKVFYYNFIKIVDSIENIYIERKVPYFVTFRIFRTLYTSMGVFHTCHSSTGIGPHF